MYAIVRTGGKQYKVAKDDVIAVEKIAADPGQSITLQDVLAVGGEGSITLGQGAVVTAEVAEQTRDRKIIVFKKKRRKNYRRKHGHRQCLTMLKIVDIKAGGKAAAQKTVAQKTASEPAEKPTQKKPHQEKSKKSPTTDPVKKEASPKKTAQKTTQKVLAQDTVQSAADSAGAAEKKAAKAAAKTRGSGETDQKNKSQEKLKKE